MHDVVRVRRLHRPGQRFHEGGRLAGGRACRTASAFRLPPATILQAEEGQAVVFADLVDLHDVGMLQAGDRLGLGAEARRSPARRGRRPGSSSRHQALSSAGPCRRRPCRPGPVPPEARSRGLARGPPCCSPGVYSRWTKERGSRRRRQIVDNLRIDGPVIVVILGTDKPCANRTCGGAGCIGRLPVVSPLASDDGGHLGCPPA